MFILATLAVIVVIGALFIGNIRQNKRDAIVLPDAAQSSQPELQPDENEPALLEVTRENVQSIVRSLHRPQIFPSVAVDEIFYKRGISVENIHKKSPVIC